jgi:cytochrome b561
VFSDVVTGDAFADGLSLPELHVSLGLGIILAVVRLLWRRTTPLPPWAEHLSAGERRLEGRLEKLLLVLLIVVPATGLLLVAAGDDWLPCTSRPRSRSSSESPSMSGSCSATPSPGGTGTSPAWCDVAPGTCAQ